MHSLRHSYFLVLAAYFTWGVLPVYWRLLADVAPTIIFLCRVLLSVVVLVALLVREPRRPMPQLAAKTLGLIALSSALLMVNWLSYLWAMDQGALLSASLAYFISPLITVALGALFLKESLSRRQKQGLAVIAAAVALRSAVAGAFPMLSLVIGASFSCYILVRKLLALDPLRALTMELLAMSGVAVAIALYQQAALVAELKLLGAQDFALLAVSGAVTIYPMLWFVQGVKQVPMRVVGLLQYLAPTTMFICALLFGEESLSLADALSFPILWIGIALFAGLPSKLRTPKLGVEVEFPACGEARQRM